LIGHTFGESACSLESIRSESRDRSVEKFKSELVEHDTENINASAGDVSQPPLFNTRHVHVSPLMCAVGWSNERGLAEIPSFQSR
jgi:hypothetical protein